MENRYTQVQDNNYIESFECEQGKPVNICKGFCLFVGNDGKFMKCKFLKVIKTHQGDGI